MDDERATDRAGTDEQTFIAARWIIGVVVCVPMLLAAGVYWLHHLPLGPLQQEATSVVQVQLVPSASPDATRAEAMPRSNPLVADNHRDLPLEEPERPTPNLPSPSSTTASLLPPSAPLDDNPPMSAVPSDPLPSSITAKFRKLLLGHIARYRRYPSAARREGLQGVVEVVFAMQRDGSVLDVWVETSSGQPILDAAAVDTIRRAQPLPVIPPQLHDRLKVLVPVAFALP